jgi:hypothetical protein
MKNFNLFLEDFKEDEKELQTGKRISDIDLAHSLALTTCSFEFECFLKAGLPTWSIKTRYGKIADKIKEVYKNKGVTVSTKAKSVSPLIKISNPGDWFVEPDGSLTGAEPSDEYVAVEIISPWIPAKDAVSFIKKFKKEVFDYFDGVTSTATGFHVNVKTEGVVANPLKLLFLFDQTEELKKFGRESNTYTSAHELNAKTLNVKVGSKYDLSNPEVMKHIVHNLIDVLDRNKYRAINFRDYNFNNGSGRIEFRIIGNDYLGNLFEKTLESVNRFMMVMASATDDKTHTKEVHAKYNEATGKTEEKIPMHSSTLQDFTQFLHDATDVGSVSDTFFYAEALLDQFLDEWAQYEIPQRIQGNRAFINFFNALAKFINVKKLLAQRHYDADFFINKIKIKLPETYEAYRLLYIVASSTTASEYNHKVIKQIASIPSATEAEEVIDFIKDSKVFFDTLINKTDNKGLNEKELNILKYIGE